MEKSYGNEQKVPLPVDAPPMGYPDQPPQYGCQANAPVQHVIIRQPALTNPPKDYLIEAILVTICCFWPVGIVAIIKALDVQRAVSSGDQMMADTSSADARKFTCISLWLGLATFVVMSILFAVYMVFILKMVYEF